MPADELYRAVYITWLEQLASSQSGAGGVYEYFDIGYLDTTFMTVSYGDPPVTAIVSWEAYVDNGGGIICQRSTVLPHSFFFLLLLLQCYVQGPVSAGYDTSCPVIQAGVFQADYSMCICGGDTTYVAGGENIRCTSQTYH